MSVKQLYDAAGFIVAVCGAMLAVAGLIISAIGKGMKP